MKAEKMYHYELSANELIKVLTNQQYYQWRYHFNKAEPDASFECWEQTSQGLRIGVIKKIAINVEKLPSPLRPFVSSEMQLNTEFFWDNVQPDIEISAARVQCSMSLDKAPLAVNGIMTIRDHADGARQVWDMQASCSVPMLGRKLEKKAVPKLIGLLDDEHQATKDYLAAQQ